MYFFTFRFSRAPFFPHWHWLVRIGSAAPVRLSLLFALVNNACIDRLLLLPQLLGFSQTDVDDWSVCCRTKVGWIHLPSEFITYYFARCLLLKIFCCCLCFCISYKCSCFACFCIVFIVLWMLYKLESGWQFCLFQFVCFINFKICNKFPII